MGVAVSYIVIGYLVMSFDIFGGKWQTVIDVTQMQQFDWWEEITSRFAQIVLLFFSEHDVEMTTLRRSKSRGSSSLQIFINPQLLIQSDVEK